MNSIWKTTASANAYPALTKDIKTPVAIIGGGMAGILTAYHLTKKGIPNVVIEQRHIGSGQTQNTTAKITLQHGLIYQKLYKQHSPAIAEEYAAANLQAIQTYKEIIHAENIDCGFQEENAYVYTAENEQMIEEELKITQKIGLATNYVKCLPLPFPILCAIETKAQAQFHPLRFLYTLAKKLTIYENTKVLGVENHCIYTTGGIVDADHIVFTTHYPIRKWTGIYFTRLYQERSYVVAVKNTGFSDGMVISADKNSFSFRHYQNILLFGGYPHRTGKKLGCHLHDLSQKAEEMYPHGKICAKWAAQDCISMDNLPFIGHLSKHTPYYYVATGFNKWGMTNSMISADIISDEIIGKKNRYAKIFSPQRKQFKNSLTLGVPHALDSALNLTKGLFSAKARTCTHMGCRLTKNHEENSYDCPCHGSRFTMEGNVINGPANIDISSQNSAKSQKQ